MLDARLIGERFINTVNSKEGTVSFYGVLYHYRVTGPVSLGDQLEVIDVTPRYLIAQRYQPKLDY